MTSPSLFTIVVPFFNPGSLILNSIRSLNNLRCRDFYVIFVDDGTNNETGNIYELIKENSFFDYEIITQENLGNGIARNRGIKKAKSEWIMFLDCDDSISPFILDEYIKVINANDKCDLVFCDYSLVNEDGIDNYLPFAKHKNEKFSSEKLSLLFLERKRVVLAPGTIYNLDFIKNNSISFESIRWSEDQLFVWNCILKCNTAVHVCLPLYNYLTNVSSSVMSSTKVDKMIEAFKSFLELEKACKQKAIRRFLASRWLFGTLRTLALRNDPDGFYTLYKDCSGKKMINKLIAFKDFKIFFVAFTHLLFGKKALYKLLRKSH